MAGRIFFGVVLILLGIVVFSGTYVGFSIWDYLPIIFILWGLDRIFRRKNLSFLSFFIIVIGLLWFISNIYDIRMNWIYITLSSILISYGFMLLVPSNFKRKRKLCIKSYNNANSGEFDNKQIIEDTNIISHNIFSGSEIKVISQTFQGGDVSVIFGGTELDLTNAKLYENSAKLVVSIIFGGIDIIVPDGWKVKVEGFPILGSISNKAKISIETESEGILYIDANVIFGGLEVGNKHNNDD